MSQDSVHEMRIDSVSNADNWQRTGLALTLGFVTILALLWPTSLSFVDVWSGGETYNHGFAILPIALWLVWQKRHQLAKVSPAPTLWPIVPLALATFGWAIGHLVGVLVVEQAALVGILLTFTVALLGQRISLYLAFPLLFLFFAVPVGEDLIPPMMEFTATFTVEALRLTGIPVYREGMWFMLPTGNWSVVEACSGVRYIIASVTLGFLYAYISYHTLWKRILFIALAALVPVLANGIRAYMIVMIGHLSDMELATGVDHLIYGWVFFGLVMMFLFWIGGFWQESHPPLRIEDSDRVGPGAIGGRLALVAGGGLLVLASAAYFTLYAPDRELQTRPLTAPEGVGGWRKVESPGLLWPTYLDTPFVIDQNYERDGHAVTAFAVMYPRQRQGYEVVSRENAVVGNQRGMQQVGSWERFELSGEGLPDAVRQTVLTRKVSEFRVEQALVWQWFRVAGKELTGRYQAKVVEAFARIAGDRSDGQWITVATPLGEGEAEARRVLEDFLAANYPDMREAFDRVLVQDE